MEQNSPGMRQKAPVFIAQGTGDTTVNPAVTSRFFKQLCAAGTPVVIKMLKGASHSFAAEKSSYQAVTGSDRFKGRPPQSDCKR